MFRPPKIKDLESICLQFRTHLYLIKSTNKQVICFDFEKQNSVLLYNILCALDRSKGRTLFIDDTYPSKNKRV